MTSSTFDFIIVGSGPAGSALAAGLANAPARPTVLLLEAGGANDDENLRVDGQRWQTFLNKDMNWGYKTTPQQDCDGRELDYSRGLGLGGSSAINFGVYSIGARDDYDEWARLVGDNAFAWKHMQDRFKDLETFHAEIPAGISQKYAAPDPANHGTRGKLQIAYAGEWEGDLVPLLDTFEEAGYSLNPDHNSGDPIGMSVLINSSYKGRRSTANDLITPRPANLTVVTAAPVQRLILEGTMAVGVVSQGRQYRASHEVILCAGTLNTPKILMHSGIGPRAQLESFSIPVIKDVAAVGQGLRDHMFSPMVFKRADGATERAPFYGDQAVMDAALEQWKKDRTGPWSKFACEMGIGWFKLDALPMTDEFRALPADEQIYLSKQTVPHYEIITHFPIHWFIPDFPEDSTNCSCLMTFYYHAQSRGEVTLQSADPDVPLKFDPKFLSTPFDRRVAIESLRETLRFARSSGYAKDTVADIAAPASDSDDDLLAYWRQTISSSWHMTGTVKMGKSGDPGAVVNSDFKFAGVKGLRVADMSVVPVIASCHVQSVAYVTGMTCAEKLIAEYGLNESEGRTTGAAGRSPKL